MATPGKKTRNKQPAIFVQIVSYRDEECQWTVKDLFAKAKHPRRVFVGICWQFDPEADQACFTEAYSHPKQVRVKEFHYRDSRGASWARGEAHALHEGEDYTLQIHPHMRFEPGWDEQLIDMLTRAQRQQGSDKAAITAFLPGYTPPDTRVAVPGKVVRAYVRALGSREDPQIMHLAGKWVPEQGEMGGLYPTPLWVGNFLFAPSRLFEEVPFDPHVFFYGEEISYSARLYTHGWNLYQADRTVVFHYWNRSKESGGADYRKSIDERNRRSFTRIKHMLGWETADEAIREDLDRYGLGKERSLKAFWDFLGFDPVAWKLSPHAAEGAWKNPVKPPAGTVNNIVKTPPPPPPKKAGPKPTIFIQIASYRDPELQHTVHDLFTKADDPARVFIGICHQYDLNGDEHLFEVPYPRPDNVREMKVDYRDAQGACWARHQAQKLWNGEEYYLQIDSHMRAVKGWDTLLISMHRGLEAEGIAKPYLSQLPAGYTLDGAYEHYLTRLRGAFQAHRMLKIQAPGQIKENPQQKTPWLGSFLVGGFVFGRAEPFLNDGEYDPHLYFEGEEISLAIRLWSKGWVSFHPHRIVLYHLYNTPKTNKNRDLHHENHNNWAKRSALAQARVRHLCRTELSQDPAVLAELGRYGLGSERSLVEFERFSGVNFRAMTTRCHTRMAEYFKAKIPIPPDSYERIFPAARATRQPLWSGNESSDPLALSLQRRLWELLEAHGVRSLLELECGALPRFAKLAEGIRYIGMDADPAVIEQLRGDWGGTDHIFMAGNAVRSVLPKADAVAVLGLMDFLPNNAVWQLLENVRQSGARFFLHDAEHTGGGPNADPIPGERRALNLQQTPFYLPEPYVEIPAGDRKLVVWHLPDAWLFFDGMDPEQAALRKALVPLLTRRYGELRDHFSNEPSGLFDTLMASFDGVPQAHLDLCNTSEMKAILQRASNRGFGLKSFFYKLIFMVELDKLKADFPDVTKENWPICRLITQEFLDYVGKRDPEVILPPP